jgi:hypothetical protein
LCWRCVSSPSQCVEKHLIRATVEADRKESEMMHGTTTQTGRKSGKHAHSANENASSLYRFWHNVRDIREDAEKMKDKELVLLVGMVELLIEERAAGLARPRG